MKKHCSQLKIIIFLNLWLVIFFFFFFFHLFSELTGRWMTSDLSCNKKRTSFPPTSPAVALTLRWVLGQSGYESYTCCFKGLRVSMFLPRHVLFLFFFLCLPPPSLLWHSVLQRENCTEQWVYERFFEARRIYSLHTKHVISAWFNLLLTLFVQRTPVLSPAGRFFIFLCQWCLWVSLVKSK